MLREHGHCTSMYTHTYSFSLIQHTPTCARTHTRTPPEYAEDFTLVYQTVAIDFKNKNWEKKLTNIYI